jgi:hypothetical protein
MDCELERTAIQASDPDYDTARRVYNTMLDRKPWHITQSADVADDAERFPSVTSAQLSGFCSMSPACGQTRG